MDSSWDRRFFQKIITHVAHNSMATKYNILFVLDSEPDKPDARIRCRVRWSGKTCAFSVGYRVDKSKWIAEAQRCKNNTTHGKKKIPASQINAEIQRFEDTLNDIFIKSDVDMNVDQLRTEFTQRIGRVTADDKRHNLFDDYATFIREEGSENKWSDGTYKKHQTVMRHLKDFSPLLTYNDLDENGLNAFSNFLLNNAGLRNGTVRKTISVTKWFLKWATRKGLNNQSAYLSYRSKLKTVPKRVIFLTWDELMTLYSYEIPENKKYLERVRDIFCFCCFTSLRYSDVNHLKKTDITNDTITLTTIKTNDPLRIELNKYSRSILNKYKDYDGEKALPVISNQKMNNYLKELGEICGINAPVTETYLVGGNRIETTHKKYELLSTHAGRRTFICNALMMGIPANIVMKWTGHGDYKAMKPYIDIADDAKKNAMKLFDKMQ